MKEIMSQSCNEKRESKAQLEEDLEKYQGYVNEIKDELREISDSGYHERVMSHLSNKDMVVPEDDVSSGEEEEG